METEDKILELTSKIANLIGAFEQETNVRVDQLNIDNRMRSVGSCPEHNILICADIGE